ncbi:unnamed protein product [Orchesella dallaii]|uniref:Uncharacterized protein n=1 Tax=Orchesella dallaii TaxID=48710 RepID=A0ABP1QQ64_9HEXA
MSSRRYGGSVSRNRSTRGNDSVGSTRDTRHATGNKRLFETDDSLTDEEDIKSTPSGSSRRSQLSYSYLDIQNRPIGSVKREDARNSMFSFGKPKKPRTTLQFDTPAVGDRENPQPQRRRGENITIIRNRLVENEDVPDVTPIGRKKIKEEARKSLPLRAKAPQTVKREVVSAGRITKPAPRWRKGKRLSQRVRQESTLRQNVVESADEEIPESIPRKGFAQGANVKFVRKLPSDSEKSPTPEPKRVERKGVARTANNVEMGRKSTDSEISKAPPKRVVGKSVGRRASNMKIVRKAADSKISKPPPKLVVGNGGARTAKNIKMKRMSADSEELSKPSPKLVVGRSVGRRAKNLKVENSKNGKERTYESADSEEIPKPTPKLVVGKSVGRRAKNLKMVRKSADSEEIPKPAPKLVVGKSVGRRANTMKMVRKSVDSEEIPKPMPKRVQGKGVGRGAKSMELEIQPPSDDEEASPTPELKHVAVKGSARRANSMKTPRKPPSDDEETPAPEPKQVDKKVSARRANRMTMTRKLPTDVEVKTSTSESKPSEDKTSTRSDNSRKLAENLPSDSEEEDSSISTSEEEEEDDTSEESDQSSSEAEAPIVNRRGRPRKNRNKENDAARVAIVKPTLKKTIPTAKGKGKAKPIPVAVESRTPAASPTPTPPPRERTPPNSQSVGGTDPLVRIQFNYPVGYPPLSTLLHHLPSRDRGVRVAEGVYVINPPSSVIGVAVGFIILDPHRSVERKEKVTYTSVYTVLSGNPEFKLSDSESSETGRPGSMFTNLPGTTVQLMADSKKAIVSFSTIILDKI